MTLNDLINADRIVTADGEVQSIHKGQTLIWGRTLPANLEELEYVSASNSQYFFVNNFYLRSTDKVEAKMRFSGTAGNCYGCYTSGSANDNFCLYAGSPSTNSYIRYDGELDRAFQATSGTDYVIEQSSAGFKANGTTYATFASATFTSRNPFGVGQLTGSSSNKFSGRIYYIIVTDSNGDEILHLVPVRNTANLKVGMYDTVGGNFYESASAKAFVAGPDKYAA